MQRTSRTFLLLMLGASALVACSGGDVILNVDILSFLTESGENPGAASAEVEVPLPPASATVEGLPFLAPSSVQLVESISDLSAVREGTLYYALEADTREGSGRADVRLRLAATSAGLSDPASALTTVELDLLGGSTTRADGSVPLTGTALELFTGRQLWLSADADLQLDAATTEADSLVTRVTITELRARIVADEDFF